MINVSHLFEYVKDHLEHFGFYPYDFEDGKTEEIIKYPEYLNLFSDNQQKELNKIFDNHAEYK